MKWRIFLLVLGLSLTGCQSGAATAVKPCAKTAQAELITCDNGRECSNACHLAVANYRQCMNVTMHQMILGSPLHCLPAPAAKAANGMP